MTNNNKCYVTMTDKFMSGWGMADSKINKLVIECETSIEAITVYDNAKTRSEMTHIRIRETKPRYNKHNYYTSMHDKTDYPNWFKTNYFNLNKRGLA